MRKKNKIIITSLVAALVLCSCSKAQKADNNSINEISPTGQQAETVKADLTQDSAYLADAKELVKTLEETHIAFGLDRVPESYAAAKEEYLKAAENTELSKFQFLMATRKYLTTLEDGHTYAYIEEPYRYADMNGTVIGDDFWLINQKTNERYGKITKVGDVKTSDLFQLIDTYMPAENDTARDTNHAYYIEKQPILEFAGCTFDEKGINLEIEKENGTSIMNLPWKNSEDKVADEASAEKPVDMESKIIDKDILYVDWNSCMLDDSVFLSNLDTLKKALDDGITKVIIDMRDNGGGMADFCRDYLVALGMQGPEYDAAFRYSPLAQKQRGGDKNSGVRKYEGSTTVFRNDMMKLAVLVNENTFSAATMLAVYVQDGNLGTVIGTKSSNSPTCYSDVVTYQMKNSGITVQMSTSYLTRPDHDADQKSLNPDIETKYGEDSLVKAEEFLK